MAHDWSLKNIWSIVKVRVKAKNKVQLKNISTGVRLEINNVKELCKRLMQNILVRVEAVIARGGRQV